MIPVTRLPGIQTVVPTLEPPARLVPEVPTSLTFLEAGITSIPIRRTNISTELQPSCSLRNDTNTLLNSFSNPEMKPVNLIETIKLLVLEGRYLEEKQNWAPSFECVTHYLGIANELEQHTILLRNDLVNQIQSPSTSPALTQLVLLKTTLSSAMQKQTALLANRSAVYEEALLSLDHADPQRRYVLLSELCFSRYATQIALEIPQAVDKAVNKAKKIADSLDLMQDRSHEALVWRCAERDLEKLKGDLRGEFSDAVGQAMLANILDEYKNNNVSWKANIKAFAGAAPGQALASGLVFGLVRSVTESVTSGSYIGQVAATSIAMAVAHETGSNFVRPAAQEFMGRWVLRPVCAAEVIPNPNPLVSVDGIVRARSSVEKEAALLAVVNLRKKYGSAQQNHKLGTLFGELEAYSAFGLAQMIRVGLGSIHSLDSNSILNKTLASTLGGCLMGGGQATLQLMTKVPDSRGHLLPTHTFKIPAKTLVDRQADVAAKALRATNLSEAHVRRTYESKTSAIALGLLVSNGVGNAINYSAVSDKGNKAMGMISAAISPAMLLLNAFAGFNVNGEVNADRNVPLFNDALTPNLERTSNGWRNIREPNRDTLTHGTAPKTVGRLFENSFHRVRGASQIASQIIPDTTILAVTAVGQKLKNSRLLRNNSTTVNALDARYISNHERNGQDEEV